jgi:hypothetical protein
MKDLQKEFVPYELALRMKALGFDESCFRLDGLGKVSYAEFGYGATPIPLYSQAFRWFREKYGIHSFIDCKWKNLGWQYELVDLNKMESISTIGNYGYNTPEEAELVCLEKLIQIVENKSE